MADTFQLSFIPTGELPKCQERETFKWDCRPGNVFFRPDGIYKAFYFCVKCDSWSGFSHVPALLITVITAKPDYCHRPLNARRPSCVYHTCDYHYYLYYQSLQTQRVTQRTSERQSVPLPLTVRAGYVWWAVPQLLSDGKHGVFLSFLPCHSLAAWFWRGKMLIDEDRNEG